MAGRRRETPSHDSTAPEKEMPLIQEDLTCLAFARPPPRWLGEGRSRRATTWSPTASAPGCRERDDEKLRPLASLAGREKDYITASPPHRDLAAIDFINGDRGLASSSWLRPPELEKK
jgi:hypothetical protein